MCGLGRGAGAWRGSTAGRCRPSGSRPLGFTSTGWCGRRDGLHLWVARRAKDKQLDPGKLDNIVAGGVPAGLGLMETLIKEAGGGSGDSA